MNQTASNCNEVDSSAWLEYFAGSKHAANFAEVSEATEALVVPVICICEVFEVVRREFDDHRALIAISVMRKGKVIDIDLDLVVHAARHGLALAESLIYETALRHDATLLTQDRHFEGLPKVRYFSNTLLA